MPQIQYAIRISAREGVSGKGFLVERLAENEVTDKYVTYDLTTLRKSRNEFDGAWKQRVFELLNQPSAEVQIEVPPVPPLEMTQAEKLQTAIYSIELLGKQLTQAQQLPDAEVATEAGPEEWAELEKCDVETAR